MYSKVRIGGSARGHLADRREDVRISTAATDVPAHELADLVIGMCTCLIQQRHRRDDLPRRAVAALKAVMTDEGILQRVELTFVGESFDRRHLTAFALRHQRQTG